MKNVTFKPSANVILPEDIPLARALKTGLAHQARRVGKLLVPAHPAGAGVFAKWGIEVVNKCGKRVPFRSPATGKMVKKLESPSHSFVQGFSFLIRGMLLNDDVNVNVNETLTDDAGVNFLCRMKSNIGAAALVSVITGLSKIKFGDSSAAEATTQINLQGVLLGAVTEAAVVVTSVTEDAVSSVFTVVGQITNTTGAPFNVEEMGIFAELNDSTGATNRTTMVLRDLTGTIAVPNTQTIIGTYTFTISV